MPVFELQGPDGASYEIEAPDENSALNAFRGMQTPTQIDPATGQPPGVPAFDPGVSGYDRASGNVAGPYDASKSYGAGLRRGAEGIAGAPGDMGGVQGSLVNWIAEKFGASPETASTIGNVASKVTPFAMMPTTEDVQQITNPIIGEGYRPETTVGKYAGTMGEFGVGALGPGGYVRKTLSMLLPALFSETGGQLTKDTPYEPYARFGGALLGGSITAPKIGGKPIKEAAADLGVRTKDMTRVIKRMQQDGMTPAQIQTRLNELGPGATMMDVGPNLRQEGQRIYAQGGRGRAIIDDVLTPRDQGANARIRGEIDANLGTAPVPSKVDAGLRTAQKSLSPEYEKALGNARAVNTETIANDIQSAMANERGAARAALESVLDDLLIKGTDVLDPHPRVALATRQAIDGMIKNTQDTNVQRVLGGFRKKLDDELTRTVPGIKEVDAKFANLAKQREAVERGQTVLDSGRTSPRPVELAGEISKGGPVIKGRLAQGARAEIDRIVGTNANDRVALQRIIKGEGDWNRDKLGQLFGQDKADRMISVLEREGTFADTSNRIMKNSATAERLPEGGGGMSVRDAFSAGGPKAIAYSGLVKGVEAALDKFRGAAAASRDERVARILSTTDTDKLVSTLFRANGGKQLPQHQIESAVRALLLAPGINASGQSAK